MVFTNTTLQGFRYSVDAMDRAAKRGLIDVLKYLQQHGQECTTVRQKDDGYKVVDQAM